MLRWRGVEVSSGALLLWAALLYLDDQGLVLMTLAACALHELGHYAVIRLLGGQVRLLRITWVGAEMRLSVRAPLGRTGQVLAALAGPAVNLAVSLAAAQVGTEWAWCFAGIHLSLALFNLLPVSALDGGKVLSCLLLPLLGTAGTAKAMTILSAALAVGLITGGLLLLIQGRHGVMPLLIGAWLAAEPFEEKKKKILAFQRGT